MATGAKTNHGSNGKFIAGKGAYNTGKANNPYFHPGVKSKGKAKTTAKTGSAGTSRKTSTAASSASVRAANAQVAALKAKVKARNKKIGDLKEAAATASRRKFSGLFGKPVHSGGAATNHDTIIKGK